MTAMSVMTAMVQIMTSATTNGTTSNPVSRTSVDIPNDLNFGQLPAVVVTCPRSVEKRVTLQANQETHTILVEYVDAPESTSDQRLGVQAARAWLETAKSNLRANKQLTVLGTPQGFMSREFRTEIAEPFDDKASGRILIHGQFEVDVADVPIQLPA